MPTLDRRTLRPGDQRSRLLGSILGGVLEVRELVVRLARESLSYLRIVRGLRKLGIAVSATSVRNILGKAGLPPAPQRDRPSWRVFLRAHGESILACDFSTVDTVWLYRLYVLVLLSIGSHRIEYFAVTTDMEV